MSRDGNVEAAISDWTDLLGPDRAVATDELIDRYAKTTQDKATRPCCILYPTSTPEVQRVVQIASKHGVVVYPISRGKNWGYGDACAPTDNAAIVDLSTMNRIIEVDPDLGYAVIEPGVSQQQLYEYLQKTNTGLWLDCTGAGLDASLVGNTLDRGFGHTRYGDHFQSCCGMEVVLGTGEVLNTGFGHYPEAQAERVYRYGVGPFLDGIFCQSNLGIVTQIGLWLMPEPEAFCFFLIRLERDDQLPELVDRLRPLRMSGTLQTAIHIGNDLRILSAAGRYPWAETDGSTPLPEDVQERLRKAVKAGVWNAGGSITGTKGHVRASKRALRRAVRGCGKLTFVDDFLLALGEFWAGVLRKIGLGKRLTLMLESLKPNYELLKGIPTNQPLLGAQWRLRQPPEGDPVDPTECGAGLLWLSPVVPMTGSHTSRILELTEPIFRNYGFEFLVTFTLLTERAMIGIINVAFDKSNADETSRAVECYDELFNTIMYEGYIPYRTGLHGLPKLRLENSTFWDVTERIKKALDPDDIIARGRYIAPLQEDEDVQD